MREDGFPAGDHIPDSTGAIAPGKPAVASRALRRLLAFQGISWGAVGIGWLFIANEPWHVPLGIIFLALGVGNAIGWMRVRRSSSDGAH
ncbi:hypothetical protein M1D88_13155 [Arthrobacter sp. R1-13]